MSKLLKIIICTWSDFLKDQNPIFITNLNDLSRKYYDCRNEYKSMVVPSFKRPVGKTVGRCLELHKKNKENPERLIWTPHSSNLELHSWSGA